MYSGLLQKIKILSLVLLLSGCGGGGGGSTGNGNGGTGIDSNDPPVANTGILFTNISTTGFGTLLASDPEGDTLTFSIVANGSLGEAVISNINTGEYTYTPNPGVEGTDVFTFKVNDGVRDSNIAVVTVHIEFNDPPVANNNTYNLSESGILNIGTAAGVLANDSDDEDQPLSTILVTNVAHGNLTLNSNGSFVYAHDGSETISDSFTYKANDGVQDSNIATVILNINPVNDPPLATNDFYTVNEGGSAGIGVPGILTNDTDADTPVSSLTVSLVGNTLHGVVFLNSDGSFIYQHDDTETTSDSFTYRASDGIDVSNIAVATITINPVNDQPVTNNDSATTNEDTPVTINVLNNDSDTDGTLNISSVVITSPPLHGNVMINGNGTITYTPALNYTGSDNFRYTVNDNDGASSPQATVTVTVAPVNDRPVASDDSANTNENTPVTVNVLANDSDVDGTLNTASIVITAAPAHGNAVANNNGTVAYTPALNYFGPDDFYYTVNDNSGTTSMEARVIITINDLPTVNAGPDQSIVENTIVNLSGTGSDTEGPVSYQWTQISGPLVTLSNINVPNPSFTAPDVSANQPLSFRLTVTDNDGAQATDTVDISVVNTIFSDSFNNGNINGWTPVDETIKPSSWTFTSGAYLQNNRIEDVSGYQQSYHLGTYSYWPSGATLTNYRFRVEATFLGTKLADDIGVMFRYQDPNNYYRLSFNSRQGYSRLEKKVSGVFYTLAANSRGYTQGELLNIGININGAQIQAYLNDDPLFAVTDTSLTMGTVALYSHDKSQFDNVLILSTDTVPRIVLSTPIAYSVSTSNAIDAAAIVTNMPVGGTVQFLLDGTMSIIDGTSPYTALFTGLTQGNHTVEAILRNTSGIEIDRDTNILAGTLGQFAIAIGDSIVNGSGDKYATDNLLQDGLIISFQGHASVLTELMNTGLGYPNIVVNEGIGGDESADAAFLRINSILSRHLNANKVLILLGTNDANSSIPSGLNCSGSGCNGTFKGNMQSLINTITATGREAWVATVPPIFGDTNNNPFTSPGSNSINTNFVTRYNQVISSQLSNRQPGPDFYSYFLGTANRFSLFNDTLHPNSLGHVIMAYLWYNAINAGNPQPLPFILNNLAPSTSSPWLKQNLIETGDTYYADNDVYPFTITSSIPSELANGRWIMTDNAGKNNNTSNYVSFSVDRAVTVYVAYDAGTTTLPSWMISNGYVNTGLVLQTTDPQSPVLNLYSKNFSTAGSITLGGNLHGGNTGANSNYIAIVVENNSL